MAEYNHKLCEILNDINGFIKKKDQDNNKEEQQLNSKDISNAIDDVEQCTNNPNLNIFIGYLKKLMNNPKTKDNVVEAGKKGLEIAKSEPPSDNLDNLYGMLLHLNNQIQDETVNIYKTYSNNTDSLISEQNKQYENFKFNNIYLFLFNLGIIFIILRNSYFKKTY